MPSSGDAGCLRERNCSKIETRNSEVTLIAITPNSAMPRSTSMASIRSKGFIGTGGVKSSADAPTSLRGALATKQSILSLCGPMDCFASLAMTGNDDDS
jgi:hypothetical protein